MLVFLLSGKIDKEIRHSYHKPSQSNCGIVKHLIDLLFSKSKNLIEQMTIKYSPREKLKSHTISFIFFKNHRLKISWENEGR